MHITATTPTPPPSLSAQRTFTLHLTDILDLAIDKEASDIHFGARAKIALRIHGEIRFVEQAGELSVDQAEEFIHEMLSDEERNQLVRDREIDFSYTHSDATVFRCNAFYRRGDLSIVMRRIATSVPSVDELGLPAAVHEIVRAKQGLFLVVGPTGQGKSTSLCSMLEEINETRVEHVVTIEDPIEYIFSPKKCIFSQRELHHDTMSFDAALRAAMRQDPDIVMIGEMRDRETITAALNLCETGHLVFSTLHTSSAAQTISRLMQAFPSDQRDAILGRLADSLLGVLSQRLIRKEHGGRVGLYELLLGTEAAKSAIRKGDLPQLENVLTTGLASGMVTMQQSAAALVATGQIGMADVAEYLHR